MAQHDPRIDDLVTRFSALATLRERRSFILDHPVMISMPVVQAFMELPPDTAVEFLKSIDVAGGQVEMVSGGLSVGFNPDRYPVGNGPIERLWADVEAKKILLPVAIERVRQPAFCDDLTFVYVKALCDKCRDLLDTDRALAATRQRIVVEATEALAAGTPLAAADDVWKMRCAGAYTWMETAGGWLVEVADPRTLAHAAAIGERLIRECEVRGDQEQLGRLLWRLGVLYIDPYTAARQLDHEHNLRFALRLWQERFADRLGAEYAKLADSERRMPDVAVALSTGEACLRRAAALQSGHTRAYTVTALVQGLLARLRLGESVDVKEMIDLIDQCLRDLRVGEDDERIIRLKNWRVGLLAERARASGSPRPGLDLQQQIDRFLSVPIEEVRATLGAQGAIDAVMQLVGALANDDNNGPGLAIIDRFRLLLSDPSVPEQNRERLWLSEVRLLRGWYREKRDPAAQAAYTRPVRAGPVSMGGPGSAMLRDAAADQRVGELLTVALGSGEDDREEEGLAAIREAAQIDGTLFECNYDALTYLQALLSVGAGTNAARRGELDKATTRYISALAFYLILDQTSAVLDCLSRLDDIVGAFAYGATFRLVRTLAHLANDVEVVAGTAGARRLQGIYRKASCLWLSSAGEPAIDFDTVFLILRLAKGCRFARCMRSAERYDWRNDSAALAQLEMIRTTKAALGPTSRDMAPRDFRDPELLLLDHAGIHELLPGSDAEQQYENLRVAFDDYLARRTAAEGIGSLQSRWPTLDPWTSPDLVTIRDVQAAIDARTVVIDYYLGEGHDHRPMLYALCITSGDVALFGTPIGDLPTEEVAIGESGTRVPLPSLSRLARAVRTGVDSLPGFSRVVSRSGEEALQAGHQVMFGALAGFLAAARDGGRDHLCIVPHRAIHFMPVHLLGPVDAGLGTEWTVTYLPVIELVVAHPDSAAATGDRPRETAVGLDFKDGAHPDLPMLERAPLSAREVADLLGGKALINAEATEANVLGALPPSRHFHLFTHGQQCVYAAAFHALYLHPDVEGASDGVLEAYQLLPLELHGVDVLTLSACESALGRFDVGDNVMGLPGSLLFAGVKTIIGTLWPVSARVAELFFGTFYREVRDRETKLAAFGRAQRTARDAFPEFRDWGAFYYVGRW
jgi:CHAT domain-containing protein